VSPKGTTYASGFGSLVPPSAALRCPLLPWQNAVSESFNGKFRDEWLSLEWPALGESRRASITRRGQSRHRSLAPSLQGDSSPFEPRLFDADGVRRKAQPAAPASATGRGGCARAGLRAPARCNIVPEGSIEEAADARSLKLTVVRRIGQVRITATDTGKLRPTRLQPRYHSARTLQHL
jgi:Integrase core domain